MHINLGLNGRKSALGYLDTLMLEQKAKAIPFDSGGMQKEAFFGLLCITMRIDTEWVQTVKTGWKAMAQSTQQLA